MAVLTANNISKKYVSKDNACMALNDICVNVEKGDFVSIVGKSGAGKSTLLFLLAGIKYPDTGDVLLNGRSITKMKDKELSKVHGTEMGIVFQDSKLVEELSVFDNIALPGYLYRKKDDVDKEALSLLSSLHMIDQKDKYPDQLSAGQKQRIAFARALINQPDIIFLDEPTGNLDVKTGRWIYGLLVKLNKSGKTIVMVTHDSNAAAVISNKVWILDSGHLKKEFSYKAGCNNSEEVKVRLKEINEMMY
jgi:putative ABC transport system ATP-binding protein